MEIIKKILNYPLIKPLISSNALKIILLALMVLGTVLLIIKWLRGRKKAAKISEKIGERKLAPSELLKIWKSFLRQIPSDFRRAIFYYRHFVVIGEAGSGKSLLIDNYTDWQGQSYQFYPSYTSNPILQFYLGSQKVVQEIPAQLLRDSSPETRKALINLWKHLFCKREPVVICVLSAQALNSTAPDSLKRQAQMMRGKINIISRIRNRPVNVDVAITHMDQMEGFLEFSDFLEKNDVSLNISLNGGITIEKLKNCLDQYEKYLPLALTTLPSLDYLKIIGYLIKAPDAFLSLSLFLKTLTENDPLSLQPGVHDIFLISNISGK